MATTVLRRVLAFFDTLVDRLGQYYDTPLGYEKLTNRRLFQMVRLAAEGDMEALSTINRWALANGHNDLEVTPCPICYQIDRALKLWEARTQLQTMLPRRITGESGESAPAAAAGPSASPVSPAAAPTAGP